jgi:hypothetical protein
MNVHWNVKERDPNANVKSSKTVVVIVLLAVNTNIIGRT